MRRRREVGMPVIDLAFPVRGRVLPSDHAYALYSAVSRLIPEWHASPGGMASVGGRRDGRGSLMLPRTAWLRFRLPADRIALLLPLAGKTLVMNGTSVSLGIPRAYPLRPASVLVARLTTIKGMTEPSTFADACGRQLAALGIQGELRVDRRGVVRIKGRKVVGFRAVVAGLAPAHSLILQEHGLGGRRKMGCGLFVRTPGAAPR
jgi:CRISPR-associated protein Cas6